MHLKKKLILVTFSFRTGMFIYPVDVNNIMSLLTGFEMGGHPKLTIHDSIRETLLKDYGIQNTSLGIPGQIKELSRKTNILEVDLLRKILLETLLSLGIENKIIKEVRKFMTYTISRLKDYKSDPSKRDWINNDWNFITSLKTNKLNLCFNQNEIELIKALNRQISKESKSSNFDKYLDKLTESMSTNTHCP